MIVVDSSAVIAILLDEPASPGLRARLALDGGALISAANYVESGHALVQRSAGDAGVLTSFERFLVDSLIDIAPIDETQARMALEARIRYGRGFGHPAKLNYGDCFAYALAKIRGLPLLFVGDDFRHTDVVLALP